MEPEDKNCLVARSKCFLKLGDPQKALDDAEAALAEDKEFNKVKSFRTLKHEIITSLINQCQVSILLFHLFPLIISLLSQQ